MSLEFELQKYPKEIQLKDRSTCKLRPLRADEGLPPLPDFGIVLLKGRSHVQPVTDALADHIEARFHLDIARPVAA